MLSWRPSDLTDDSPTIGKLFNRRNRLIEPAADPETASAPTFSHDIALSEFSSPRIDSAYFSGSAAASWANVAGDAPKGYLKSIFIILREHDAWSAFAMKARYRETAFIVETSGMRTQGANVSDDRGSRCALRCIAVLDLLCDLLSGVFVKGFAWYVSVCTYIF